MAIECHFFSDDIFLLSGLREYFVVEKKKISFYVIDHHKDVTFNPRVGDIVVVAIENLYLRRKFIENHRRQLSHSRLIIIANAPVTTVLREGFPWIAPASITIKSLRYILSKAKECWVERDKHLNTPFLLFEMLCSGKAQCNLTDGSKSEMNAVSRIKCHTLKKFGLDKCNSVGVILCRDIFALQQFTNQQQRKSTFAIRRRMLLKTSLLSKTYLSEC